jgi:hypothetical protein
VHFGSEAALDRVVLWDVNLLSSEAETPTPVARRGDRYDRGDSGRPELHREISLKDVNRDGLAVGLWERQLDRDYFLFGVADIPPQDDAVTLEVSICPEAVYPRLRLLDAEGRCIKRASRPTELSGFASDEFVKAEIAELGEGELAEYFESDHVDYLPMTSYERFRLAPLTRKLRIGDYIEWTGVTPDGAEPSRRRGEIVAIRKYGTHLPLEEMGTLALRDYEFTVRDGPASTVNVKHPHGYIRLAPRPPADGDSSR